MRISFPRFIQTLFASLWAARLDASNEFDREARIFLDME